VSRLKNTPHPEPNKVGVRKASTFRGFCDKHDHGTFLPIEERPFTGSQEQCFLAAYRAICHEFYQKRAGVDAGRLALNEIDDEVSDRRAAAAVHLSGAIAGQRDISKLKRLVDQELVNGYYSDWRTRLFWFKGDLSVASAGCFNPDFDLAGERLQDLTDLDRTVEGLICSPLVSGSDSCIACFSHRCDDAAPAHFLDSLEARGSEKIGDTIVQIYFGYLENTYFSQNWWRSLRPLQQEHIRRLALTTTMYDRPLKLIASRLVPWTLDRIDSCS